VAKKQTFADKVDRMKGAGAQHCPVCDEIPQATKVKEFINSGGNIKQVTKMMKICKCNSAKIFG
jgi:hypothetical protein